ncbi:TraR/DksA family transcriptional regulator [Shewanella sp. GXUN23E]|uniref:TraR/DksA family transcriptional regulator n=1 Tax=Shewanella sp. GXUN23E TaxID=3422498 RepID=UPI003D7E1E37
MNNDHIQSRLDKLTQTLCQQACELLNKPGADVTLGELIDIFIANSLDKEPLYHRLLRLDAARCQLELGLYGLCADCEEEIEQQVLNLDITAQRCDSCQSRYDNEHRHELLRDH